MKEKEDPVACPRCGSTEVIPILYGMPGPEMALEQDEGKLKLGGCCIFPDCPNWHCKACGHEWLVQPGPYDSFDEDDEEEEVEESTS